MNHSAVITSSLMKNATISNHDDFVQSMTPNNVESWIMLTFGLLIVIIIIFSIAFIIMFRQIQFLRLRLNSYYNYFRLNIPPPLAPLEKCNNSYYRSTQDDLLNKLESGQYVEEKNSTDDQLDDYGCENNNDRVERLNFVEYANDEDDDKFIDDITPKLYWKSKQSLKSPPAKSSSRLEPSNNIFDNLDRRPSTDNYNDNEVEKKRISSYYSKQQQQRSSTTKAERSSKHKIIFKKSNSCNNSLIAMTSKKPEQPSVMSISSHLTRSDECSCELFSSFTEDSSTRQQQQQRQFIIRKHESKRERISSNKTKFKVKRSQSWDA